MIALPIPDKRSPVRYRDLTWRGRNLGEVVATLTRGRQRSDYRAHLDPDLRQDICHRESGWRPTLGQHGIAQGHLRKKGVGVGDLFLFWGVFRVVDHELRWLGRPEHHIWGWLQVGAVAPFDEIVRNGGELWRWARAHPHWAFPPDRTNTLYVASDVLSLPNGGPIGSPGSGVFDFVEGTRRLSRAGAASPSEWSLPSGFLPMGRPPLSYHDSPGRWSQGADRAHLLTVARGQEFVLDLEPYPELSDWLAKVLTEGRPERSPSF
jgi:putative DNA base modification enzyme with NMAD domain